MEHYKAVEIVATALQSCITANYEKLIQKFTLEEIYDFANTVVAYLPDNYEYRFTQIDLNILTVFADKKNSVLESNITDIMRTLVLNKLNNNQEDEQKLLNHLLFFILMLLKTKYEQNVDSTLDNITNYYKSILLSADDLKVNVQQIVHPKAVAYFNNKGGYVRFDDETYKFIPTITTKSNFNYLII